jgi:hypothetical protein
VSVPDTTDLRSGIPVSDTLLALLALVGVWEGDGHGVVPSSGEAFDYRQRITIAHDGRPFLAYDSRAWLVGEDGSTIRQAFRENGFWRMGADADAVEFVVVDAAGLVEVFSGVAGDNRWELVTTTVTGTPTARSVVAEHRLYSVTENALMYATELDTGTGPAPHLNARLSRGQRR